MSEPLSLTDLEDSIAKQTRRTRTEAAILGGLMVAGVVTMAVLAPNAVQLLRHVVPAVQPRSQQQSVRRAIGRLIKQGYIVKTKGKYRLSAQGRKRFDQLLDKGKMRSSHTTHSWDHKWRIVIFDIKESRRAKRDELRSLLTQTGFIKLQDSVWVYPFRCDETISLLKFHLTLGRDLVYIIADAIEGDERLRKHFGLPSEH